MNHPPFELTACQQKVMKALNDTHDNLFITGCAGTGKSHVIREYLKSKDKKTHPVLASTGAASVLLGGRTFHSFFGLGLCQGRFEDIVEKALKSKPLLKRLKNLTGFVLDEISMISGEALAIAETICGYARQKPHLPWGGARVIAVGDFAQLPPVTQNRQEIPWAFLNPVWKKSQFENFVLTELVRSSDTEFLSVLEDVRAGRVNQKVTDYLNERTFEDTETLLDRPYFFPHRKTSEAVNTQRLHEISGPLFEFITVYQGSEVATTNLKKNLFLPEVLQLKKSAFVMLRVNDPAYKYVNGSLGHIIDIDEKPEKPVLHIRLLNKRIVEIEKMTFSVFNADGLTIATAENFPVNLAYATTIHKSQGMTLERMCVDLKNLWEPGQAYVALSRLKSGDGLSLMGWTPSSIRVDAKVMDFYKSLG